MSSYIIDKEIKILGSVRICKFHVRKKGVSKKLATFKKYEDALDHKEILEKFVKEGVLNE